MASNQHRNLTGEQLHNPKGFDGASPSTTLIKNAAGEIEWRENTTFDNALDYVSPQLAPPTEVEDDIYLLDDTGVVYDIDTIAWQSGNTIRYTFNGTPNLSAITAGDYLVTSGNGNSSNDGTFVISAVNDGSDYIEITNANRSDATDDEASDAVGTAYYTLEEWDGASKGSHIKFDGTNWNSINAQDGALCYDETSSSHRIYDAANTNWDTSLATGGISGSGTADYVARFTPDGSTLGNSVIQDNGSTVGINTSPLAETDLTTSRTSAASTASANIVTSISGSNTNTTKGIDITASNTSSGTVWGTQADISTSGTSNLIGHEVLIDTSGSGTITANAAYYVNQLDAGGTTTVSNAYGFLSDGVGGAGTTTNAYHVYLTAHSSGTNKYGIYQAGASDENFFAGDTTIGQLKFDASQTVTASEDNYVLTYDHSTGKISLEASAGGGSSLWSENVGDGIYFNTAGDSVAIGDTATNGNAEGAKFYVKGDSSLTYVFQVDRESDALAMAIDSTTGIVDIDVGATIGASDMFDIGKTYQYWVKYNAPSSMKMEWMQAGVLKARILTQSGYGSFQIYNNAGVSYYKLDGVSNNYENTGQDFTFGTTTSLGARVGIRGTGTGSGTSSLLCQDSGGTSTFEVLDNGTAKSTGQIGSSAGATPNTETPTGTTETIDWNNGNYQILDLESASGNVTLTLSNPIVGFAYFIEIRQDSTTPLDVIFPSSVKFAGETAPYTLNVSTGANAVDAVSLAWNGSEYIASFSQNHG
jgi:hypothetical protein